LKKKINYKKIEIIRLIIIFIFSFTIIKFFNLPYNFYSVLKWDYNSRMTQNYGFCKNEGWGFINHVNNSFKLEKNQVQIINDEGFVSLKHFFNFGPNKLQKPKNIILLNFQSENDQSIKNKYEFMKDYKLLYRKNNCYLLSLK